MGVALAVARRRAKSGGKRRQSERAARFDVARLWPSARTRRRVMKGLRGWPRSVQISVLTAVVVVL